MSIEEAIQWQINNRERCFDLIRQIGEDCDTKNDVELMDLFLSEMLVYVLYVATLDGSLKECEVHAINNFVGINNSYEELQAMLKTQNLDCDKLKALSQRVPASFDAVARYQFKHHPEDEAYSSMEDIISHYRFAGWIVAISDDDKTPAEDAAIDQYTANLREHLASISNSR